MKETLITLGVVIVGVIIATVAIRAYDKRKAKV